MGIGCSDLSVLLTNQEKCVFIPSHTPLHLSENSLGRQIYLPVPLSNFTISGRDYVPVYFSIFYFLATNFFSWGIQYTQRVSLLILPSFSTVS